MRNIYEHIAPFYDVDMARNMDLSDVDFWLHSLRNAGGPILEIGCGTGRITRRLAEAGLDMVGIDRTAAMLERMQEQPFVPPGLAVIRADARSLPFVECFNAVLCSYSFITNLLTDADLDAGLREAHRVLHDGGLLLLDAFFPRSDIYSSEFALSYQRPWEGKLLQRWQRISRAGAGLNRIERQYRILNEDLTELQRVSTTECIRPFAPVILHKEVERRGFSIERVSVDYDQVTYRDPRFYAFICRKEKVHG